MAVTVIKIVPVGKKGSTLHSVEEALNKVTHLAGSGKLAGKDGVVIRCGGGIYPLEKPIHIRGKLPCPLTIESAPGEQAVFDGGVRLENWKETTLNGKKVFVSPVPANAAPDGFIRAFYVNGVLAKRASFPKDLAKGYEIEKGGTPASENDPRSAYNHFYPKKEDFDPSWYNLKGMEVLFIQKWTESYMPFKKYTKDGALHFHCNTALSTYQWDRTLYFFCNVREALTEEGEYYFDNKKSLLYYLPRKGEKLSALEAVLPMADMMFCAENTSCVTLRGLTFSYGGRSFPKLGQVYDLEKIQLQNYFISHAAVRRCASKNASFQAGQGAIQLPGILCFSHAEHCSILDCAVERCSWYGIQINSACSNICLQGNTLHHLGGGGIVACGANSAINKELWPRETTRITISDNHIHHCGEIYLSATGIMLGHVRGCLVEHNHIHDLYYSGISCGYTWGYQDTVTAENRILFNHIHDLGKNILCDMGGIYMLGPQPGSRVAHNLIYNVDCRYYGGWALYTDEGSSHIILENNVTYDCSCEGYHHHYGRENILRGNLFLCHKRNGVYLSKGISAPNGYSYSGKNFTASCNFFNNVIVSENTCALFVALKELLEAEALYWDNNVYWDLSGKLRKDFIDLPDEKEFPKRKKVSFDQWKKLTGNDRNSLYADPGFKDIRKRDLHLRKDSILRKMGFPDPAVTLDQAGIRKDRSK